MTLFLLNLKTTQCRRSSSPTGRGQCLRYLAIAELFRASGKVYGSCAFGFLARRAAAFASLRDIRFADRVPRYPLKDTFLISKITTLP
jgi:hypothetical protein